MKKVLAIVCGRSNGQTEQAARVALKAAQEKGCEVELVNIMDLEIKPCIGCGVCSRALREPETIKPCPLHKDDMKWLDDKILSSDALLFGAPMFEQSVPGPYKTLCDRFGPSHDVTFVKKIYEARVALGIEPQIDTRWFRERPVAFFGLGGSEWSYLSYPTLAIPAIPLGLKIVDREQFDWNRGILANEDRVARMKRMGEHLADMADKEPAEMTYIGREGYCPQCHNDVMRLGPKGECTCSVCGVIGKLTVEDGEIKVSYTDEMLATSHVTDSGRAIHFLDLTGRGKPMPGQVPTPTPEQAEKAGALAAEYKKAIPAAKPSKREEATV